MGAVLAYPGPARRVSLPRMAAQGFPDMDGIRPGSIEAYVAQAAWEAGVPRATIRGKSRIRPIAHCRQFYMWLAVQNGHSQASVGRAFNRDHTTVAYAIKEVEKRRNDGGAHG